MLPRKCLQPSPYHLHTNLPRPRPRRCPSRRRRCFSPSFLVRRILRPTLRAPYSVRELPLPTRKPDPESLKVAARGTKAEAGEAAEYRDVGRNGAAELL